MTAEQQNLLFENTARAMGDAPSEVKLRHIGNCLKADKSCGEGVAKALDIPMSTAATKDSFRNTNRASFAAWTACEPHTPRVSGALLFPASPFLQLQPHDLRAPRARSPPSWRLLNLHLMY
jgi:hypothetical protein